MSGQWNHKIFGVNEENFGTLALEIFNFQYENNPVYKAYSQALGIKQEAVLNIEQIPFLPISFFKSHQVKTTSFEPAIIFESSGTTGTINSRHHVKDITLYDKSFKKGFEFFYGPVNDLCIIGLLPSYLEKKTCLPGGGNSSLVYMTKNLIHLSGHPQSGFYLDEYEKLFAVLNELEKHQQKTLLLGVTYALLDFAEKYSLPLKYTTIMETGGMKGRRDEMIREEVHAILNQTFSLDKIHSEYGMTELFSQAYSKGNGIFNCPPWMKVMIRDDEDPLNVQSLLSVPRFQTVTPITGAINIIDLANFYSCSFIATDDVGKLYPDGSFEVLGRMDGSDLRGCSLMVV